MQIRNHLFPLPAALAVALALCALIPAGCSQRDVMPGESGAPIPASRDKTPLVNRDGEPTSLAPEDVKGGLWIATNPWKKDIRPDKDAVYSLASREQNVKDVLLALGQQSPYNFVIAPDVQGSVTLDLKDVSLTRALKAILDPLSLEYRIDGDVIWVQVPNTEPEMFQLSYVITERSGSTSTSGSALGDDSGGNSGFGDEGNRGQGVGSSDSVTSSTKWDLFANIVKELKLYMSPKGKVQVSRETGLITVLDYRKNLHKISQYLAKVEEVLSRQVVIDVMVMEISLTKEREFGIDWTYLRGEFSAQLLERTADRVLTATLATKNLTTILKSIRETRDVTVKTRPQVMTMNNQPALVVLGEDEVFFEHVDTINPETGEITRTVARPRSVTIGVSLHVVPSIGADGRITLDVHPRVTEKVDEKVDPTGIAVPELSVREVSTVAQVRDGETMMIGGLVTERRLSAKTGAPLLSTIPIIGTTLFQTKRSEKRKIELVIFITPTIVRK